MIMDCQACDTAQADNGCTDELARVKKQLAELQESYQVTKARAEVAEGQSVVVLVNNMLTQKLPELISGAIDKAFAEYFTTVIKDRVDEDIMKAVESAEPDLSDKAEELLEEAIQSAAEDMRISFGRRY